MSRRSRRWGGRPARALAIVVVALWALAGEPSAQQARTANSGAADAPSEIVSATPAQPSSERPVIEVEVGEVHRLQVDGLSRIAIGRPEIADLTIVSPEEVLIHPKAQGMTNLIVWDQQGQRVWDIHVGTRSQAASETQLRTLIDKLTLPHVTLQSEEGKLFVMGTVASPEEDEQIERMLAAFPEAINIVRVVEEKEGIAPPPEPAPLVKLVVQIIDVDRLDLEELGISWSQSIGFSEPEVTDRTLGTALTRFGTSITRGSFTAGLTALVQRNRARVLTEPKLVTASGKEASSFVGVEVPIIKATSFSTETTSTNVSIDFRQVGALLTMTPYVQPNDPERRITMVIAAEVSDVDTSVALGIPVGSKTISVPGFKVRKVNTEVTTVSGGSIVIAGLLDIEDFNKTAQVPALGSLPVLGRLFKKPEIQSSQRELVIVVTPELLGPMDHDVMAQLKNVTQDHDLDRKEAMAVAEVTAATMTATSTNPVLRYATQVQERIAKAIRYPQREKDHVQGGRVKLRLHLFRDGRLDEVTLAQSSGTEAFDQEVLMAAQLEAPYPPFPSDLAQQDLWLELPVLFAP